MGSQIPLKILNGIIFLLISNLKSAESQTDVCGTTGRVKTRLQVAFVIDRTYTFEALLPATGKIVKDFHARISKTFPGSEIAITTFADFTFTQRYDNEDKCYTLYQPFTTRMSDLYRSLSQITPSEGNTDNPENSLQGLMFTGADTKIGWNSANQDADGTAIQRVLILITDMDDLISVGANFKDAYKRHAARGDGSDTCTNSLYPNHNLIAKVLQQRKALLIGALAKTALTPKNIIQIYTNHFNKLGVKYNLFQFEFQSGNPASLAADLEREIYKTVPCKPMLPPPPTPPPPPPMQPPPPPPMQPPPPPPMQPPPPTMPVDMCGPNGRIKTRLQVAFVVDRTGSFQPLLPKAAALIKEFHAKISKTFPGSQVAVTSFADFTYTQRYDEMDKCYNLDQQFTTEYSELDRNLAKLMISIGNVDFPENSLQAIMFTCADKTIGWNTLEFDPDGAIIQRVIILITDDEDLITTGANFKDAANRHPALGDGSDTCTNSLYPDYNLMGKVLKERNARIIGALAMTATTPVDLPLSYSNHFTSIGATFNLLQFKIDNIATFASELEGAIYKTIPCKPEPIIPPPPSDICGSNGRAKTRLQVAFVIDRTRSFQSLLSKTAALIKEFLDKISKKFPGSQIAVTSFADFTDTQRYDESDKCYSLDQGFTTSLSDLESNIAKLMVSTGSYDFAENSLQALFFTCADTTVGWNKMDYDTDGAIIQRVVVLITDDDDLITRGARFKDAAQRHPAKGDGSDTCTNSLYPDYAILGKVVKERNALIIGALAMTARTPADLLLKFSNHFNNIGASFNLFQFKLDNIERFASELEGAIYNTVPCKPEPVPKQPSTPTPSMPKDICGPEGKVKTKLQIALVIDRTNSIREFWKKLPPIIQDLHRRIIKTFPDSEIGLTSFADFTYTQRYDDTDKCYKLDQPLTANMKDLDKSVSSIGLTDGNVDWPENSLQAIMLTAADQQMGWNGNDFDANGIAIQRVILMVTDADDLISTGVTFKDASQRHPAKGDGTDTCTNSLYPDYSTISKVLSDRKARVIAALAKSRSAPPNIVAIYTNHFEKIGVDHNILQFEQTKLASFAAEIEKAILKIVPVPCKEPTPTQPTTPPVDECEANGNKRASARIQLAFVMDRTASFTTRFFRTFGETIEKIFMSLNSRFPGTKVAMTLFTDFTSRQWNHNLPEHQLNNFFDDETSCYARHYKFISNFDTFKNSTGRIRTFIGSGGDATEDQLTAIMMTAADKELGWNNGRQDKKGTFVYKLICMLTDSDTHPLNFNNEGHFLDFNKRRPAKGDGTDTCSNALLPTHEVVAKLLRSKGIRLVGLLSKQNVANIFESWDKHFDKLGVMYNLAEFNIQKVEESFEGLVRSILMTLPCDIININTVPPSPAPTPPTQPPSVPSMPPPPPPPMQPPPPTIPADMCGPNGRIKTRLQVAFVVDRTGSFQPLLPKAAALIKEFHGKISKTFPGSQVAVTSFADFTTTQRYDEMNKCYNLDQQFTTEYSELDRNLAKLEISTGNVDFPENSLQALMFTCADNTIGWNKLDYDPDGAIIQRVIILITDDEDLISTGVTFKDAAQRHPAIGDGSDTCTNSLYPDYNLMGKVLKERNARIIGALGMTRTTPVDLPLRYTNHFTSMGASFNLLAFQIDKIATFASELEGAIYKTIPCKPEITIPPPPSDICGSNGRAKTRLQVAFVIDRTRSFQPLLLKTGVLIKEFLGKISKKFPGSQIAVTSFADFTTTQRYDENNKCYSLDQQFTASLTDLESNLAKITVSTGSFDFPENSLQALFFTCADRTAGWNKMDYDTDGAIFQRVVILITDDDDLITKGANFKDAAQRHPAKGDGSDTCTNSLYPDYAILGKVVKERNALLIGALAITARTPSDLLLIFKNHFTKIGASFNLFQFKLDDIEKLGSELEGAIYNTVPCKPEPPPKMAPPPPPPPPPTIPSAPPPPTMPVDICGPNGRIKTRLQVAFVVDRTGSFEPLLPKAAALIKEFHGKISKTFPGSQVAVTSFADFTTTQRYDEMNKCYNLDQQFTTEYSELGRNLAKLMISLGNVDFPENSLQALMFTCADLTIGWNKVDYDADGAIIQRVIILITDDEDLISTGVTFKDAAQRHPAIGDGSDTCTNSLYPDYNLMGKVLKERNARIIGALAMTATTPVDLSIRYTDHFTRMGATFNLLQFKIDHIATFASELEGAIYKTIPCKPEPIIPPPPSDICGSNGRAKTRLQVAFVIDRTRSFQSLLPKTAALITEFLGKISKKFPGSQIAVTSFADFTATQRYDENNKCYSLDQLFTSKLSDLESNLAKIAVSTGSYDFPENSLQALMFTCADKTIGWNKMDLDTDGAIFQRVVVLITDDDDLITTGAKFKDAAQRHPAKGDGSDTCTNSLYPDYAILGKVVKERNALIIGALAMTGRTPADLMLRFSNHFKNIGASFNLFQFKLDDIGKLGSELEGAIYNTVPCKPDIPPPPPQIPPPPPNKLPPVDICGPNGRVKTKLQVAFVIDRTYSFETLIAKSGAVVRDFSGRISKTFPGSEIAVTSFADFTSSQRYDETNKCYNLDQVFTTSMSDLENSLSKITASLGSFDFPENSLQALMFTGADTKIGWNNKNQAADGAFIQHVIILITDNDDLISNGVKFKDESQRHAPKGDGTDTCTNSLYPDYNIMAKVLNQKRALVIGAFAKTSRTPANIFDLYTNHFTKIGVPHSLFQFEFEPKNPGSLATELERAIYNTVPCKPDLAPPPPPPPKVICMESRVPTSPSHSLEFCHPLGSVPLDDPGIGNCFVDANGKFVVTEDCPCDPRLDTCPCDPDDDCDEWDPPGYNTLAFSVHSHNVLVDDATHNQDYSPSPDDAGDMRVPLITNVRSSSPPPHRHPHQRRI
ncbi:unnamed protein product [Orchesella dallaii]|uniref:VWFA domain-containing protein n=1 Tax=Orchesella dallaii TaxID=48710 RepID=A0ABP1PZX0_9HEXA